MNGTFLSGRNIKVGRPSNMPQAQSIIEDIEREATDYFRIYIGGIHKDLGQDDIKSVFEAFGSVKHCELAPAGLDGKHKGYGFLEYDNLQSCLDAIASMNQFDLGGQYLRVGRAITPPDIKNTGSMDAKATIIPTASAVAAAAITAKIQAMDAVATNLGVTSQDITDEERKKRDRRREEDRERREKERERRRERSRERESRRRRTKSRSRSRDRKVKKEKEDIKKESSPADKDSSKAVPVPPTSMPSLPPDHPGFAGTQPPQGSSGDTAADGDSKDAAAKAAVEKAQQLELQKKLMEGDEAVSLSQQENMQIKGQSARHLVMQKLMGAHGGLKESKVVVLRNMVGHEEVDESLQEEIEEECGKFGEVDNVIIYQERQSEEEDSEILVKIFVEFAASNGAKAAKESLNGRFFGGRHVRADIYDQVMFEEQDFSH